MSESTPTPRPPRLPGFVPTLFFGAALLLGFTIFLSSISPKNKQGGRDLSVAPYPASFLTALDQASVEKDRALILANGDRSLGQPGHAKTADRLAQEFRSLGLPVVERRQKILAPVVEDNRILDADGQALQDTLLHPFLPNYFQPIATPPEGISGKLVLLDDAAMKTITDFSGLIGVVKMDSAPKGYDLSWKRYTQIGLKGLILTNSEGPRPISRPSCSTVRCSPLCL